MGNPKKNGNIIKKVFDNFEAEKIVNYTEDKLISLIADKGIVRNQLKINSVVSNAKAFLRVKEKYGSFAKYIWSFVDGKPIINHWETSKDVPVSTEISDKMSKQLKKDGFKFVGTTICYSYMQAVGMVNDHTKECFCYLGK